MRSASAFLLSIITFTSCSVTATAWSDVYDVNLVPRSPYPLLDDRPPSVRHVSTASSTPTTAPTLLLVTRFGGDDCSTPVCGSLADGENRPKREGESCDCNDGWSGINCNVCESDSACDAMMPEGQGGRCYKQGVTVKQNFQMCDVTNRKIVDQLDGRKPQVTFSCTAEDHTCNFQFWVGQKESFYCGLDTCEWNIESEADSNTTNYKCENAHCSCIKDRFLCGENGSIDLSAFLDISIKGPATFSTKSTATGSKSSFSEPEMNKLISGVFGDPNIFLSCDSGECLYKTDEPGYERPIKKINTPLIAGVIAGCSLFVVAVILLVWYLSRRAARHGYALLALSDDSDDETAKLLEDHRPAALYWDNVSYNLNGKEILSGIQGASAPGQITAIMGASGAGKTTFLDILARKNKRGSVHGNFYVNGEKIGDHDFKSMVGFVDQEDTMLPTLTVHETILTSALLRLPRDMSRAAKEQRVLEVEKQLGIYHIKDQLIGSEEGKGRGISGGEKRRVGIACELVTSPSILFLDEPTSGLDAFNAFNVVECLVTLAKTYNRTVIFTIHQPRSNIVALFDRLILLAGGRTVYSGPFSTCQQYFDRIGYSCPPGFNIADYLVDLTMHAGAATTYTDEVASSVDARTGPPKTASSSLRAVKSVASASNVSISIEENQSGGETTKTHNNNRRVSVKQQQERQLYSRRKDQDQRPTTPKTDEEDATLDTAENTQQWLRLHRQQGSVPPQILDDPDQLPPPAPGQTDLDILFASYADSDVCRSVTDEIIAAVQAAQAANGSTNSQIMSGPAAGQPMSYARVSLARQFIILSQRTWRNLYRNPMLMLTHYAIAILLAVLSGYLFYGLTDDIKGFQNRLGLFFFLLALFGFSTLTSLNVFSTERLLFVRERANGYYHPVTYFAAKVVFDIVPLRLIPPIIMGIIVYPMTGLIPAGPEFLRFLLVLVLFNLAAANICLFIGIVFRDGGVANLIGSLVMLFSLLFAGLLLNHDAIPDSALWLQSLSIFHYGFEALIVNEVTFLTLIDHKYGLDIEVPGASILSAFGFNNLAYWSDVIGLAVISGAFIIIAYAAMHFLLVEKR
ncbi:ABC transporter G family member [Penicillium macrosclerotiorum]|uniref:ABC transporter G family member n=1 Tax=Penicillium macrosclerotiorum TaxID=303699 RepID=UPI0025499BB3|nr:ABC transporter G family member [Penicillium macrosclerotiorum]KAJ5669121.1 ABC transporter G family member [Penicillium macrosclerotiorum]